MKLENKHVLLTGASGGIGQAIASDLASAGARLTLVGRHPDKLEQLRTSLPGAETHRSFCADLTRTSDLERLNDEGEQLRLAGQGIDIMINNAGVSHFNRLSQRSIASVQQELTLNLTAPVLASKLALSWLNRPGIILNIGSTFGGIGFPGYSVYCAAKSGIYRFSEALDRELSGSDIRVLYVAPRATDTDMNSPIVKEMNEMLGNRSDPPQHVAQCVLRSLEKELTAHWIGWPEKLFVRLNQWVPGVVAQSIRKQQIKIQRFMAQVRPES
jgi:short-subunit dehydrogenase